MHPKLLEMKRSQIVIILNLVFVISVPDIGCIQQIMKTIIK